MNLTIILLALLADYFIAGLTRFRRYGWFISLYHSSARCFASFPYRSSALGLVGLLFLTLLGVYLLSELAANYAWFAQVIFNLLVLLYCLAPNDLARQLNAWVAAVSKKDTDGAFELTRKLMYEDLADANLKDESVIIKSAFVKAHKNTFAALFWFLLLGAVGVLLYRLTERLHHKMKRTPSDFSDSVHLLLNILEWPPSRLMVIGLLLAGNLVEALLKWKESERWSFGVNSEVLIQAGLGALQYPSDSEIRHAQDPHWITGLKSLLNRTLIIWLVVLGGLTLSGMLT